MPIYEIDSDGLKAVPATSFSTESIYERRDMQRVLRQSIDVLGEHLLVIAEEFGEWLDSSRRIDLLCLDGNANLVVIELKRTDDGGFMELQALRYAAMISAMTFDQLVDTHARFLCRSEPNIEAARESILAFLGTDDIAEEDFGADTRIILAGADFSKELTTTVMWLIDRGLDIRCVRLKPYKMESGQVLLDIQQLIPLPEAAAFQTQIGVKRLAERQGRSERHDLRLKYWEGLISYLKPNGGPHANRSPTRDNWLSGSIGRAGFSLNYVIREGSNQVELWIALGPGQKDKNKRAFNALRKEIEEIENEFGAPLRWDELADKDGARISFQSDGGYRSNSGEWPSIWARHADAMNRLEICMRRRVQTLKF